MAGAIGLNDYKREVFIEGLNPKTTKVSLEESLSNYQIDTIEGPLLEKTVKEYCAIVRFHKASNVDHLMTKRPYRIDGQDVRIYRSIPNQGLNKGLHGIKSLVVLNIDNTSLEKSDLERYFSVFGEIASVKYEENFCRIEFKDYDSVDKALLDVPHIIRRIKIDIKKYDRNNYVVKPKLRQAISENNLNTQKKIDPKQAESNSSKAINRNLTTKYCIHVTNLPLTTSAEYLSAKFRWSIYNIVMGTPTKENRSQIECWLKDIDDSNAAKDLVECCNGQNILGSKIQCEIEDDKPELCNHFRLGHCERKDNECRWAHILCSANGKCPSDCPYGHARGEKTDALKNESNESYQLKISGFQANPIRKDLAHILNMPENNILQRPNHPRIAYLTKLREFSYARKLMKKWHNNDIGDGQILRCQIELFKKDPVIKTQLPQQNDTEKKDNHPRETNYKQPIIRKEPGREPYPSSDDEPTEPRTVDDIDINREGIIFAQSCDLILKQKQLDTQRKSQSMFSVKPRLDNEEMEDKERRTNNGRFMSQLRKRDDHGSLAFLIEYKETNQDNYYRELAALQALIDVQGVVQLVDIDNSLSNMKQQQNVQKNIFHIITERPSGCTLKEFAVGIYRDNLGILEAIQIIQKLLAIVKRIHAHGVLHQNLDPENIMINWNPEQKSSDRAQLVLLNFSQAYLQSNRNERMDRLTSDRWYKAPQLNDKSLKYSSTIDASHICAILLWLLTNIEPKNNDNNLPHEQHDIEDRINRKIAAAVKLANVNRKPALKQTQLKTYLIDTFNIAFGYPKQQPWTIDDLESRLESIHELLLPNDPKLDTLDAVFQELLSTNIVPTSTISDTFDVHKDIFQKASNAFQQVKKSFTETNQNPFTWSDGGCTWLHNTQTSINERRHDDILTYFSWNRNKSSTCSIIIISFATLENDNNIITLSIGSTVNGKMSRIPVGRYSKSQNYVKQFQEDFSNELNNLIISICKQRKAIQ